MKWLFESSKFTWKLSFLQQNCLSSFLQNRSYLQKGTIYRPDNTCSSRITQSAEVAQLVGKWFRHSRDDPFLYLRKWDTKIWKHIFRSIIHERYNAYFSLDHISCFHVNRRITFFLRICWKSWNSLVFGLHYQQHSQQSAGVFQALCLVVHVVLCVRINHLYVGPPFGNCILNELVRKSDREEFYHVYIDIWY